MTAQSVILRIGKKRFGPPAKELVTWIQGITDLNHLEKLCDAAFTASGWQALIDILQARADRGFLVDVVGTEGRT
jgi:hypothetical protein